MKKLITALMALALLSGCGGDQDITGGQKNELQTDNMNTDAAKDNSSLSDAARGDHLEKLASSIPGVNGATAIIAGRYAVVGIDVDRNMERSEVGTVKYSVAESIRHDPHGAGAVVVADPDLNARIGEIKEDMESGQPIEGIMNELADITGRLIPEGPADEQPDHTEKGTEDSRLDKQDERKLEQEQRDHSTE